MSILKRSKYLIPLTLALAAWAGPSVAQSDLLTEVTDVSEAMLVNPSDNDWLMWRRTYDGAGFSPLDEIDTTNVADLKQAFRVPLEAGANMPTPLVHDGVLYLLSTRDTLLAMDATSGELLWSHRHGTGFGNAKIGIALSGDKVIMPTGDMHMLALNNKTGEVIWDTEVQTTKTGRVPYSLRAAPIVANGVVVQGVTATMMPDGGFILGFDIETGEELWRFHSIAREGEFGGNTWNDAPLEERTGGSVWMPGTYDPELNLIFYGTAPTYDTATLLYPVDKPGITNDGLYTNSTVALRPDTGELVWHYQHISNDQWDLDWVYERHLVTIPVDGVERKVVITAGKIALYDALDAATGEYLFSIDLGIQNLISAIDPDTGKKTMNANATPNAEDTHLVCPFANGGRNWQSASYNPTTKMLYLPISEMCMSGGPTGVGGLLSSGAQMTATPHPDSDGQFGRLQAVNLETRELEWTHRETTMPTSAALATGGGVVFGGNLDESFKALDQATGEILWQTDLGDIPASFPISYAVDGKQYVALVVGQPTIHANVMMGVVVEFLGAGNPIEGLSRDGAALLVYALD